MSKVSTEKGDEQSKVSKEQREEYELAFKSVMNTEQGRRFFWTLLEDCGIYRSSFTGNSSTFFNEGERNVGLKYMTRCMDICPDLYLKMQSEQVTKKGK